MESETAATDAVTAPPARTPRSVLAGLQEELERSEPPLRRQIMEAMLAACGEHGYRNVSVRQVIERYGGYRTQFYRQFSSKEDCFMAAYEWEAERLCDALIGAAKEEEDWRAGLRAALRELARYCRERPQVARGLILESRVAGGIASAKRRELVKRLSRAVDSARRETNESRHSPSPEIAVFMIGAVESVVGTELARGEPERIERALPQLAQMIVTAYFGDEAGREELEPVRWLEPAAVHGG